MVQILIVSFENAMVLFFYFLLISPSFPEVNSEMQGCDSGILMPSACMNCIFPPLTIGFPKLKNWK